MIQVLETNNKSGKKIRTLLVNAYPIQNVAPHRLLAKDPRLHADTVYLADPQQNLAKGKEFINQSQFDIKVLDDSYRWELLRNISFKPSLSSFIGLVNPKLISLAAKYDCIVCYGHGYVSFWFAILTSKFLRKKLILTTDATYIETPDGKNWKVNLKKKFIPFLYGKIADKVWVPSSESKNFLVTLGVVPQKIVITPYTVDNDFILSNKDRMPRNKLRDQYGIPSDAKVLIFCAKFIPRKRPHDALEAFKKANIPNSFLLMIGDGPLKEELEILAKELNIQDKVIFAGLVKYSELPSHYGASDVLVFTSETEQFGLPVNEAMLCGIPVVISDRLGCRYDLVDEGITGYTYPCGDTEEMAKKLIMIFASPEKKEDMGRASKEKIVTEWSPEVNARNGADSIVSLFS